MGEGRGLGWNLEVISGLEEGRLIHRGVMSGDQDLKGKVLLIDLGGGSCEITLSENKRIRETVSLPLGAVRLTEEFLTVVDPAPPEGLAQMRQLIARELRRARRRIPHELACPQVIATSGTAAALAEACAAVIKSAGISGKRPRSSRRRATTWQTVSAGMAGFAPAQLVRKLAARMGKLSLPDREALPGIGPRRAEIIVAGAEVYAELLESFGLSGFRYSPLGLRDGILALMLDETDTRARGHREFELERWESVLATARRYGVDPKQAEPVRAHALQLYRELKDAARPSAGVRALAGGRRRTPRYRQVHQPPGSSPALAIHRLQLGGVRLHSGAAHHRVGARRAIWERPGPSRTATAPVRNIPAGGAQGTCIAPLSCCGWPSP